MSRIDWSGCHDPSTQVFMADGPAGHCSTVPATAPYSPDPRHKRQLNICFLDGHVAAFTGMKWDAMWVIRCDRM